MSPLRQLLCAVRGHDEYLRFQANRVFLECIECGRETPGWNIDRAHLNKAA